MGSDFIRQSCVGYSCHGTQPEIILNPIVSKDYTIANTTYKYVTNKKTSSVYFQQYKNGPVLWYNYATEFGHLISKNPVDNTQVGVELYETNEVRLPFQWITGSSKDHIKEQEKYYHNKAVETISSDKDSFWCLVSFDLVNKSTRKTDFSFSKYFKVKEMEAPKNSNFQYFPLR